jgi:hypothetical protein
MQALRAGTVSARARSKDSAWIRWCDYCDELAIDPMLFHVDDPIPFLQVFAERWRTGKIAPREKSVKSRTVEAALRAIGQTMASVGANDIRLTPQGKIQYRIQQQLKGYKRVDTPPSRVKPIPFYIVDHANGVAAQCPDAQSQAAADIATIGFFFLLRPGEHTYPSASSDSAPFRLMDVTFKIGALSLKFTTQKNAVSGEIIGHATSGHSLTCPVKALVRRVTHLREHLAIPTTPLCTFYPPGGNVRHLTPSILTATLRSAAATLFQTLGFDPTHISARALRAGGAMALLCAQVDTDVIKLVGRWHSDEMLRYLHLQAYPLMRHLAPLMVAGGQFRLLANETFPAAAATAFFAADLAAGAGAANTAPENVP